MKLFLILAATCFLAQTWNHPQVEPPIYHDRMQTTTTGTFTIISPPPTSSIRIGGSQIIEINDKEGKLMVHIDQDGKVTYGTDYKADDAAKTFWETLAKAYPVICEKVTAPTPAKQ